MILYICSKCGRYHCSIGLTEAIVPKTASYEVPCDACKTPLTRVGEGERLIVVPKERDEAVEAAPKEVLNQAYTVREKCHLLLIELDVLREDVDKWDKGKLCGRELTITRNKLREGMHWFSDALSTLEGNLP